IGVACETTPLGLTVHVPGDMQATTFSATPYPGLPTDVQAQFMALLATVPGVSRVTDTVFPDRFIHAAELVRMGADIQVQAGTAVIHGVSQLSGAAVMASDLRASAALVLGALAARGRSEILRVYHLDRGYAAFDQTLIQLGADVRRLDEAGRTESVRAGTPFPDAPIADTTIPARNISSGDSLRSPVPAPHLQSLSLDSSENYSGRTQQTHVSTANPPKNLSFENNGPFDDSSEKTDP
ncbi:MAG: hypothetical protein KDA85_20085, partial [Planctomycetaceae bacterium]|nr:hypothetical protein [Planctomycetaceae bacterium]